MNELDPKSKIADVYHDKMLSCVKKKGEILLKKDFNVENFVLNANPPVSPPFEDPIFSYHKISSTEKEPLFSDLTFLIVVKSKSTVNGAHPEVSKYTRVKFKFFQLKWFQVVAAFFIFFSTRLISEFYLPIVIALIPFYYSIGHCSYELAGKL